MTGVSVRVSRGLAGACLLFAFSLLLALAGCTPALTPQDVADRFWRAAMTEHPAKMRRYVRAADRVLLEDDADILPLADFELGRTVIDADSATIETGIVLATDQAVSLHIDTVLVREDGAWCIDYAATVNDISRHSELAQVIQQIEQFGDGLKHGIDQSVDELKRALPKIQAELSRIEAGIKQQVPELRKRVEDFARQLQDSLRAPPPKPPPSPDGTIAI